MSGGALALALLLAAGPGQAGVTRALGAHGQSVTALAFSPTGATLASAGRDRQVLIWSLAGGQPVPCAGLPREVVGSLGYSPDGARLAMGTQGFQVIVASVSRDACTATSTFIHPDLVTQVAFSPDGKWLAVAGHDGEAALYPAEGGKAVASFRARSLAWVGHAGRLATVKPTGELSVGEPAAPKSWIARGRVAPESSVASDSSGALLSWSSRAARVQLWAGEGMGAPVTVEPPAPLVADPDRPASRLVLAAAPLGPTRLAVLSLDGMLRLWTSGGKSLERAWPTAQPTALAVSPAGDLIAVGDGVSIQLLPASAVAGK